MFLNARMVSGLLAVALCAWIAGWVPGTAERILIMVVGSTAVFLAMFYRHEDGVHIRRHSALETQSDALIDHPSSMSLSKRSPIHCCSSRMTG
ncbi:MAG: hypothetical protein IPL18_03230 [Sphingomonadales bacterium]|nr:hypothetical protein [Sphingomonadales bacterium]